MAFGTAAVIVTYALLLGLGRSMESNVTSLGMGEVQVYAPGFLDTRGLERAMPEPDGVVARAREKGLDAAARGLGMALVSRGQSATGTHVWGVDPVAEARVSDLPRHLAGGDFLISGEIVLGSGVARSLGVGAGDEVSLQIEDALGFPRISRVRVAGVLASIGDAFDQRTVLVHDERFESLFGLPERHEVVVTSHGGLPLAAVHRAMREAAPDMEIHTWRALSPTASAFVDAWDGVIWIFVGVFFLVAGLGVLNTNLMAVYERIPEFGLARALGATPRQVLGGVAVEAGLIAAISTLLGGGVGLAIALVLQAHGIDLTAATDELSFSGMSMEPAWQAHVAPRSVWQPIFMMWLVSFVATLQPALRAVRLDPIAAMHRT